MNRLTSFACIALSGAFVGHAAYAQQLPSLVGTSFLLPSNPTSADTVKLNTSNNTCGGTNPYIANPYKVSASQNNITVTLGERTSSITPTCPSGPREEIDLGRLPAGSYTITLVSTGIGNTTGVTIIDKAPFTITDARANKAAPYVRLDYSGHWWDPNDSGWGLFIWQDARNPSDSILAAWFTYTSDGKPMWYVFQPKWATSSATLNADLLQGTRLPGTSSPPATTGSFTAVGTAKLDFTNFGTADEGKITYTFNNGATLTRTIQRFRP
jgi:hypothetical protein